MTTAGSFRALRAAAVGLVASACAYGVVQLVKVAVFAELDSKPDVPGLAAAGAIVLYGVEFGVVAAVASSWLGACLLRLPRPWLFALAGLLPGMTAVCGAGWLAVVVTPLVYAAVALPHRGEDDQPASGGDARLVDIRTGVGYPGRAEVDTWRRL